MLEFLIDDYCKKNPLTTDLNAKTIKIEKLEKGEQLCRIIKGYKEKNGTI